MNSTKSKSDEIKDLLQINGTSQQEVVVNAQVKSGSQQFWSEPRRLTALPYFRGDELVSIVFNVNGNLWSFKSANYQDGLFSTPGFEIRIVMDSLESQVFKILGLLGCAGKPLRTEAKVRYRSESLCTPIVSLPVNEWSDWINTQVNLFYDESGMLTSVGLLTPPTASFPVFPVKNFIFYCDAPIKGRFHKGSFSLDVCAADAVVTEDAEGSTKNAVLQKWEYKVVKQGYGVGTQPIEALMQTSLNELGQEGWELVSSDGSSFILKRPC